MSEECRNRAVQEPSMLQTKENQARGKEEELREWVSDE